ncbi:MULTISPECIES: VTT domain-containing protein [unclassified Methanoculleus]|uniref:VTT domain-containing protein n=1 Tax=unclassified Methanoculleus TaxID=2619537 RepID=UPI0025D6EB7C|nr:MULTISPECIES: VTT domain-containing protein [unclassified Methanoculleus]MCK9316790.1 VTT domain-containing protein [Methanoculleus sp.]MDD2252749.1 VTT domain-containing protein [Methanoculleus sp.]MDD2786472.1 VTT domain-containing protein [Methanoculleus sp.]MDD3215268.1 VTT domain-containing protein [Methanoculleus sp.]MDD4312992.1 VTT domain-containing protein [Methanoculleus sp.]
MFEQLGSIVDLIIHFDDFLPLVIEEYGTFVYFFLFLIIFLETGVVVTPYLPGDSLLFLVGAIAAQGGLNILSVLVLLIVAAIAGDTVNYWIGRSFGSRFLSRGIPFIKEHHIAKTESYFKRYGGRTIVIARFAPFVRTLAPFLAGTGKMDYSRFIQFNAAGGVLWVSSFIFAGFLFGNVPFISENFSLVVFAIIAVSMVGVGSMILPSGSDTLLRGFSPFRAFRPPAVHGQMENAPFQRRR